VDADAWLRTIESKFALLPVPCSEENKTLFAAQQLRGIARIWWDNYHAMLPADHAVTWEEFRTTFRAHHIPEGLLERKLNEFLALTQGNLTVLQYAQVFNHLCQYAGYHADSDAKKQDHFRCGLKTSNVSIQGQEGPLVSLSTKGEGQRGRPMVGRPYG